MAKKMNEHQIQRILIDWALNIKNHHSIVPNTRTFMKYAWENDLISVTKTGMVHEYEIKISQSDYRKEFKKKAKKHAQYSRALDRIKPERLKSGKERQPPRRYGYEPNYFWIVSHNFECDPEPPPHCGLIGIIGGEVVVVRKAPRLHNRKLHDDYYKKISRWLSFRLSKKIWTDMADEAITEILNIREEEMQSVLDRDRYEQDV